MGLDMYLRASKLVSGHEWKTPEQRKEYADLLQAVQLTLDDLDSSSPSGTVTLTVAYWRKANAIHAWFVDNVQDGEDKCEPHEVSREQLSALRDLCAQGVANRDVVSLQPRAGFFFGGTEVDEYYYQDLAETVAMLGKILDNPKFSEGWYFEYKSSW